MIRLLESTSSQVAASQMTPTQQQHSREVYKLVVQFHNDIANVITATKEDEQCNEEHCRLFNSLVDRTIEVTRTSAYDGSQEAARLRNLRVHPLHGSRRERTSMSAMLSKVGYVKAFLEGKLEFLPAGERGSPILSYVLLTTGAVLIIFLMTFMFRMVSH